MATEHTGATSAESSDIRSLKYVPDFFRYWAGKCPERAAFIFRSPNSEARHVLTFGDLYQLAGRWAWVLHEKGIGRGDVIVNVLSNSPERAVAEVGILLSGALSVDGSCDLRDASDLVSCLRHTRATGLVVDPDVMGESWTALRAHFSGLESDGAVVSEELPALNFVFAIHRRSELNETSQKGEGCNGSDDSISLASDTVDFLKNLKTQDRSKHFHTNDYETNDVCVAYTSSGTTGPPKVITYTHRALVELVQQYSAVKPPRVEFNSAPMGWSCSHTINTLLWGSTRVLCDNKAGSAQDMAEFIYNSVLEEGAVTASLFTNQFQPLADKMAAAGRHEPLFRSLGLGTQPITKEIVQTALKVASCLSVLYASTETLFVSTEVLKNVEEYKDFCAGKVIPEVDVKIRDSSGKELRTGERGEIFVKTPYGFHDYLNLPDVTSAAFGKDGYFQTGDIGWFGKDGRLYVLGRSGDTIMHGYELVQPTYLESIIRSCPQVKDVIVVPIPHPVLVNELCACVVKASSDVNVSDIREFVESSVTVQSTDLLPCTPHYYLFFDQFPTTRTGKVNRREIKARAIQMIGKINDL